MSGLGAGILVLLAAAVIRPGRRGLVPAAVPRWLGGRRWLHPPARLVTALVDADVGVPAAVAWSVWVLGAVAAALVAAVAGGPALALVVVFALLGGPLLGLAAARGRSGRRVDAALPAVLDGVARSLRSGATLAGALAEQSSTPGRLGEDLRAVLGAVDGGVPLVVALDALPLQCPTAGVRLAVAALALAAESGGAAARAVDGVAATLRANLAVAGEVRAQAAQARLSGLVIALAPLAFATLAAGADGRTAHFLLHSPVGSACVGAGLVLDGIAAWWMHRITGVVA